jgi:hypothetical protein
MHAWPRVLLLLHCLALWLADRPAAGRRPAGTIDSDDELVRADRGRLLSKKKAGSRSLPSYAPSPTLGKRPVSDRKPRFPPPSTVVVVVGWSS